MTKPWRVIGADPEESTRPDGWAIVTADWTEEGDRAEHYIAERITHDNAHLIVTAVSAFRARNGDPTGPRDFR